MKFLIIYKRKYSTNYAVNEFGSAVEMLNAILDGDYEGDEIILARKLALTVTDAAEIPATEIAQPSEPPAHVVEVLA